MPKTRLLSGIQPSGKLHIGNYLGAIQNWVNLQDTYDCFFEIADLHALTTLYDEPGVLKDMVRELTLDLLGCGIDPHTCTLFVQSEVPEHAELHLIFSMMTPISWLERVPSFKDKIEEIKSKDLHTHGFLGYPVLQTADIALYKGEVVPVGQDQLPHLELAREMVRRFHHLVKKEIFPEPKSLLTEAPMVLGFDGRKMSKSYGNTIGIDEPRGDVAEKIRQMITDPKKIRKSDIGRPEICSVFGYHKLVNKSEEEEIAVSCRAGTLGCVDCKTNLAGKLNNLLDPIRDRRQKFAREKNGVEDVLSNGRNAAEKVASQTMHEVREILGMTAHT